MTASAPPRHGTAKIHIPYNNPALAVAIAIAMVVY